MRVLGIHAVFHDPAALVAGGEIVFAAEEERYSRRKHGKTPVPFSTWEMPEKAARACLARGGIEASELDAVAFSYDPALREEVGPDITARGWERLRSLHARDALEVLGSAPVDLLSVGPLVVRRRRR